MADLRFDGQVAIVTGAGSGLGRAYAHLLAARGARVLVNDLAGADSPREGEPGRAEHVAAEIRASGGVALADGSDVAAPDGGRAIVEKALRAWGRVDAVINNAGIVGRISEFQEMADTDFDEVLRVHLHGSLHVARAAWTTMLAQRYGRILNTSSGAVFGMGGAVAYPTAKAALLGFTRNLAVAGRLHGIRVNALMPIAHTPMGADLPEPLRRWQERYFPVERVAPVAAFLVHREVPCSGEVFTAGGGRIARVFLGVTPGHRADALSLETLRDHFAAVLDPAGYAIPADTSEEIALYGHPVEA